MFFGTFLSNTLVRQRSLPCHQADALFVDVPHGMIYDVSREEGEPCPDLLRCLEHRVCERTGSITGAHAERKGGCSHVFGALSIEVPTAEGLVTTRFGVDLRCINETFVDTNVT